METINAFSAFDKQLTEDTLSFSEFEVEIMVDGGFLATLTDLLQNEAVRETVGKILSEKKGKNNAQAYIEQEVQAGKNIFACRWQRRQNCTTPILTSPSTSSSTWPGVFMSLNKKKMRIAEQH